jgi:hypothetical protein
VAVEIAVKKYVVKLSDEERERLNGLIKKGKHPVSPDKRVLPVTKESFRRQ